MASREPRPLADQAARRAIANNLASNMVVVAGAGTGKTTSLAERIVNLIDRGETTIDRVAAITFTQSAAIELRDRIRGGLERREERRRREPGGRAAQLSRAIANVDSAAMQTIHAFAAAMLRERPMDAGLPPGFVIRDAGEGDLAFQERWSKWLDDTLESASGREALRPAFKMGMTLDRMQEVARRFHANYDLLADAPFDAPPPARQEAASALVSARGDIDSLLACNVQPDALSAHALDLLSRIEHLDRTPDARRQEALAQFGRVKMSRGSQSNWGADPATGNNACKELKSLLGELDAKMNEELDAERASAYTAAIELLRLFAIEYAEERRVDGEADFQDLLVWTRELLRENIKARDYFREKWSHILIDEAQDTDPIQAEIALFLAEEKPQGLDESERPRRWQDVTPSDGKLFIVGDPKQSIYRFRRADITQSNKLLQHIVSRGGKRESLTQNFRSLPHVIAWTNHLFGQWMQPSDGQPDYEPLRERRENDDASKGSPPAPRFIGAEVDTTSVAAVRREEAAAIAATILAARGSWTVWTEGGETKPASFRDICILMPKRIGLPNLEYELEASDIPYRLESAGLVYETQEARDLLNCLRAIDDPTDQVSVVAALRSPAFVCSDADLAEHAAQGRRFDYMRQPVCAGRVGNALGALRDFHARRMTRPVSTLIDEFARDRRLMELALDHPRPREKWRRYRFLMDTAQALASKDRTSLREFLQWTNSQQESGEQVRETAVPDADEDAVRVMTVHGAKGLEFPIVILTSLNSTPNPRSAPALFHRRGAKPAAEVKLGEFTTPGYDDLREEEKSRESEEGVRLLYVAATRARDHLVISMYRKIGDTSTPAAEIAARFEDTPALWESFDPYGGASRWRAQPVEARGADWPGDTVEARKRWVEERSAAYRRQSSPTFFAATSLTKRREIDLKKERDEEGAPAAPWRRGRAGTSIGRAVHAVLQTVDLRTGVNLEQIARAQSIAEGLPERAREVERLARVALDSDVVRRALRSKRVLREAPAAAPFEDVVVEGFIDLLFEEDDGLVIVDYKTDALRGTEAIDRAMAGYRAQGGAYALAISKVTGRKVKQIVFLFLEPKSERCVDDVEEAMREAAELIRSARDGGQ